MNFWAQSCVQIASISSWTEIQILVNTARLCTSCSFCGGTHSGRALSLLFLTKCHLAHNSEGGKIDAVEEGQAYCCRLTTTFSCAEIVLAGMLLIEARVSSSLRPLDQAFMISTVGKVRLRCCMHDRSLCIPGCALRWPRRYGEGIRRDTFILLDDAQVAAAQWVFAS